MGGFFGVTSTSDCCADLFYGTDYHSHLGTRRGGMAITNSDGRIVRRIHDISNAQFRSKFDDDIEAFDGCIGVGVISDYEDQPLIIASRLGVYAIVTVGKVNNLSELVQKLFRNGGSHLSEMSDGETNQTELVASLINQKSSIIDGIEYAQSQIDGSCSILIMINDILYAARDRFGRTPVIIGSKDGAHAVTMETTAFPNLDYVYKCDLGPGEIAEITPEKVVQKRPPNKTMRICAFLWVYYGYPSSYYEGINAETVRYRNGATIARDDDTDIDAVCGIPDSGVAHAIGYANFAKKPYERAFVKYTPTWPRSFMPQNQKVRDLVARMKLIPIREQIAGKRLLFCDDSIVRGTQLKDTVKRLYEHDAKEVHMRSACPPLVFGCKFLNFSRSRSELDLAARRAVKRLEGELDSANIPLEYTQPGTEKYEKMVAIIRQELNLTTLKYQSLEKLIQAIGLPKDKICTYCWDGKEPENESIR